MTLTAEQMAVRRTGIGSSDIPAIIGVSPFRTVVDVWMDKMGMAEPQPETAAMKAGNRLERVIGEWCAEEIDASISPGLTMRGAEYEWAVATPDFIVLSRPGHIIECKNVGVAQARGWRDGPPEYVLTQVFWQMWVTGAQVCHVAALFGGRDFRRFEVERDDSIIRSLVGAGRTFWEEHVLQRTPPPLDASEASARLVARLFPVHSDEFVQATEQDELLAESLRNLRAAMKGAEEEARAIENQLKARIGGRAGVAGAFGRITWKKSESGGVDYKAAVQELVRRLAMAPEDEREFLRAFARPGTRRFVPTFREDD